MDYDVVYFVKDSDVNEELTYSLRSVEKNFPFRKLYVYGGLPKNLYVKHHINIEQRGWTKWDKVAKMIEIACMNDHISEWFWLFNDDFYVMRPPIYDYYYSNGDINKLADGLEKKYGYATSYCKMLRHSAKILKEKGYPTISFATHTPILINRDHALKCMREFEGIRGFRSLYGNYELKNGNLPFPVETGKDVKIRNAKEAIDTPYPFLSSSDLSFQENEQFRKLIMETFPDKSRYER